MLGEKIKRRLKEGNVSFGAWLTMAHLSVAEIFAAAGYDWVMIETEHTSIDMSEVMGLIMAVEGKGGVPLVRLSGNDPIQAKAVLDAGAAGIMVPMVNSKAEAERAVAAVKYPPEGIRGACGAQRGQEYGFGYGNYLDYVRSSNKNSFVMVQIEHIDAVNNIEEIASVPGLDGTFIGPYDLAMSMGLPGQLDHPDVEKAKRHVLEITRAHGLAAGIHIVHPDTAIENLKASIQLGYQFLALGTDILFLGNTCRTLLEHARKTLKDENRL